MHISMLPRKPVSFDQTPIQISPLSLDPRMRAFTSESLPHRRASNPATISPYAIPTERGQRGAPSPSLGPSSMPTITRLPSKA